MSEEGDDGLTLSEAWELLESYNIEEEDGALYEGISIPLAEGVYKALVLENPDEDDKELRWVIERFTLIRLYRSIANTIDEMEGKENWRNQVRLMTADDVVLFFTLADELVSGLAGDALNNQFVSGERNSKSSIDFMTGLKHDVQMDFLYYSGVIDNGLKGELTNIHKTRNKLIHDLRHRHYLDGLDNIESRLLRAIEAINELYEIVKGHEAYLIDRP